MLPLKWSFSKSCELKIIFNLQNGSRNKKNIGLDRYCGELKYNFVTIWRRNSLKRSDEQYYM